MVILTVLAGTILPSIAFLPATSPSSASSAGEVHSDFNGDGFDDMAVGVPFEDIGSMTDVGAVNVIYGSSAGLSAVPAGDTGRSDQFWTQNSTGVEDVAEGNEYFGSAIASGDFNADGFSDLATGVYGEKIGTQFGAGAVNLIYGSSIGLRASPAPDGSGRADQFWSQDSPGVDNQAGSFDRFGSSLAVGDFNGDGKDDLAIGALGDDAGDTGVAGAVNVLYGSSSGLQTSSPADQFWTQDTPGVEETAEGFDFFGWSLAAGDFNSDGKDDLAIGVRGENGLGGNTSPGAGAVNVLYGSSSGLQTSSPADQLWDQDSAGVDDAAAVGDGFGSSLAVGDFNNDGREDLAVGAPGEEIGGGVNLLYGSLSGLQTSSPADQFWSQDSPGVEDVSEDFDQFGNSLASGDFNYDGFMDLAIGAPHEDGAVTEMGVVHVLYGTSSGLSAVIMPDQRWTQNSPGVNDAVEAGDLFGSTLAVGDYDGDGNNDLAVGSPMERIGNLHDAGAVNVLYGSSNGLQTVAPADQFWHQNRPDVNDRAEGGDRLGTFAATPALLS